MSLWVNFLNLYCLSFFFFILAVVVCIKGYLRKQKKTNVLEKLNIIKISYSDVHNGRKEL